METAIAREAEVVVEPAAAEAPHEVRTAADVPGLLRRLGDVAPERVLLDPLPGTATEADALRLKESADMRLCELIDGTLVEKAVGDEEGFVAAELIGHLMPHVRRAGLGRVSASAGRKRMSGGNVRMPDVSFVANDRLDDGHVTTGTTGRPPHLAVEILSISNTRAEMRRKRTEYFASGVVLVWEIDPQTRTAAAYAGVDRVTQVPADGALDGGELLPGFSVRLADLFEVLGERPAAPDARGR